jgi:hypothetical protein
MISLSTQLDRAVADLMNELLRLRWTDMRAREALSGGASVRETVTLELLDARAATRQGLTQVSKSLRQVRSAKIRALVDHDGLSISQVAALLGHPRQMIKRLYDADEDGEVDVATATESG